MPRAYISTYMNTPPKIKSMGAVNWVGLWTLYMREVRRFMKVYTQTMWGPVER